MDANQARHAVFTVHSCDAIGHDRQSHESASEPVVTRPVPRDYLAFRAHPPGFPLLIAPLIGILGTNFYALNLTVSLFGAAGAALLAIIWRPRLGWTLAVLTATVLWTSPGYQRLCNQVMSDVPGTTLLLLCLLLERWSSQSGSRWRELVLGLCIGLSAYVRAVTLVLVPAIAGCESVPPARVVQDRPPASAAAMRPARRW